MGKEVVRCNFRVQRGTNKKNQKKERKKEKYEKKKKNM
jgi:hypothetical protein